MEPLAQVTSLDGLSRLGGSSNTFARLLAANGDLGILRPFIGKDGYSYITVNEFGEPKVKRLPGPPVDLRGRHPLAVNAANVISTGALLPRNAWDNIDTRVRLVTRPILRAWNDLRRVETFNLPNALGTPIFYDRVSGDIGNASIGMDPIQRGNRDKPTIDERGIPVPFIFADTNYTLRDLSIAVAGGMPISTRSLEGNARKMAEILEKLTIGVGSSFSYNGLTIYGYLNHPDRVATTMLIPTNGSWTPTTFYNQVLAVLRTLMNKFFYGPFTLYHSPDLQPYLDQRWSTTYDGGTLRTNLQQIPALGEITQLDYMGAGFRMALVQRSGDTARAVVGMDLTTTQWSEQGGYEVVMKQVMCAFPQLFSDANGNIGIADISFA